MAWWNVQWSKYVEHGLLDEEFRNEILESEGETLGKKERGTTQAFLTEMAQWELASGTSVVDSSAMELAKYITGEGKSFDQPKVLELVNKLYEFQTAVLGLITPDNFVTSYQVVAEGIDFPDPIGFVLGMTFAPTGVAGYKKWPEVKAKVVETGNTYFEIEAEQLFADVVAKLQAGNYAPIAPYEFGQTDHVTRKLGVTFIDTGNPADPVPIVNIVIEINLKYFWGMTSQYVKMFMQPGGSPISYLRNGKLIVLTGDKNDYALWAMQREKDHSSGVIKRGQTHLHIKDDKDPDTAAKVLRWLIANDPPDGINIGDEGGVKAD